MLKEIALKISLGMMTDLKDIPHKAGDEDLQNAAFIEIICIQLMTNLHILRHLEINFLL